MEATVVVETTGSASLASLAAAVAVDDILVFRRISTTRYAHLGGLGRGEGWAGIVELELSSERSFGAAVQSGAVSRTRGGLARVVGPYYARAAEIVPVSRDVVVVWGAPYDSTGLDDTPDEELREMAAAAARIVSDVSPAKRLADELEVLQAVQTLTGGLNDSLDEALAHVVRVAAEALSCEVAVLLTACDKSASTVGGQVKVPAEDALVALAADALSSLTGPVCVQDARTQPLPAPLSPDDGVLSYYLVPLSAPVNGVLVLAHTAAGPRGFTQLCCRLGLQIAEAGSVVLHVASLRYDLQAQLEASRGQARRDSLTGLGNRHQWDESLALAQTQAAAGEQVSVICVDLDGLKLINDEHGHAAGDDVLLALAGILEGTVRTGLDTVCRLGGDEFGLLLRRGDSQAAADAVSRLRRGLSCATSARGLEVSASIGWATVEDGGRVLEAFHDADIRMYQDKAKRCAARGAPA